MFRKVHIMAVRIVAGLPVFAPLDSFYFETGWKPLSSIEGKQSN
jgi:hypothetical protein